MLIQFTNHHSLFTRKLVLFLFVSLYCVISSYAQDADALIKRVKDKLAQVNDYQASAVLKTDVSFMKIPESNVDVFYKKPDKFRIKKQGGISVVPKGGVSINLNSLFADDNYTAVPAGETTIAGVKVSIVKLLPLSETSDVVVSTLYIEEKSALIRKATTTTRENGTYEMELGYGKFGAYGLPDKVVFTFNTKDYKLPKGLAFDYDTGDKPAAGNTNKNQKGKIEITYSSYSINKGIADDLFSK
jgi:outer membrane lipoprotein-sorting protein